jgi:hypothetical protein
MSLFKTFEVFTVQFGDRQELPFSTMFSNASQLNRRDKEATNLGGNLAKT